MTPPELLPASTPSSADAAQAPDLLDRRPVPAWAASVLILTLWLIARPYRGVRHDGILYLGQTLAHWMPATIGRDLFLTYGSQDRYSIFSALMAPVVKWLGVGDSQLLVLAACEIAFMGAAWLLTAELPSRFLRWCALLSLVALSHTYTGGGGAFGFAEPFLSARSMAEPFALVAIALALRKHVAWALVSLLAAFALHALIALPALVTIWVLLCLRDRRWLAALVLPLGAGVAGALGAQPFNGLWQVYDPAWWAQVRFANANVFIRSTEIQDWGTAAFDAMVIYLASCQLPGTMTRQLLRALLIVAPVLTGLWALGADLVHDVLLTQLQVWRIYWLMHFFALLTLPVVLLDAWRRGPIGRWAALALGLAAVAVSANFSTQPLCMLWAALPWCLLRFKAHVSTTMTRLASGVSVGAILMVTGWVGWQTRAVVLFFPQRFNGAGEAQIVLGLSAVTALVGFVALRLLARSGTWRWAVNGALMAALAFGGMAWDQRSAWQRFEEASLRENDSPFAAMVPSSATVYWQGDTLLEPWLLMKRPQFFSFDQSSGLLFSRQTAIEFSKREGAVRPWIAERQVCMTIAVLTGADPGSCYPSRDVLDALCHANPHPDFMVFQAVQGSDGAGSTASWTYRPKDARLERTYRLYDCAQQP